MRGDGVVGYSELSGGSVRCGGKEVEEVTVHGSEVLTVDVAVGETAGGYLGVEASEIWVEEIEEWIVR